MLKEVLEQAIAQKRLVAIKCDPADLGTFCLGYIHSTTDDLYVIEEIDSEGRHGGFHIGKHRDIVELGYGSEYENAFSVAIDGKFPSEFPLPGIVHSFDDVLEWSQHNQTVIRMKNTSYVSTTGIVQAFDDDWIKFTEYKNFGKPDGTTLSTREFLYRIYFCEPSVFFAR